jgi:hypothetical protein
MSSFCFLVRSDVRTRHVMGSPWFLITNLIRMGHVVGEKLNRLFSC